MAAVVELCETNGAAPGTVTHDVANLNVGSTDAAELTPSAAKLTAEADGHSFEKWFRMHVTSMGGSTILDNLKVWLSSLGGGWKTGEGMSTNLRTAGYSAETYDDPVDTDSAVADQAMPEAEPGGPNLGIGGSLAGQITAPGYSDYAVIQLDLTAATPSGALNQKTLTLQWDEQ